MDHEDCDDGGITSYDGCTRECKHEFMVFVSSIAFYGDLTPTSFNGLTGLDRADANCQQMAEDAGLSGVYLAWLADTEEGPLTRFGLDNFSGDFRLFDGRIARGWPDLADGAISAPIDLDQYGEVHEEVAVWTNTWAYGEPYSSEPCSDWTSAVDPASARVGNTSRTDTGWSYTTNQPCHNKAHLYCFQVTP